LFSSHIESENRACSDGYQFPIRGDEPRADQDPIFKAAAQLTGAFLGFTQSKWINRSTLGETVERFVPVLVTTAPLYLIQNKWDEAPLSTGRLESNLNLKELMK
jgi:hypothetical protein